MKNMIFEKTNFDVKFNLQNRMQQNRWGQKVHFYLIIITVTKVHNLLEMAWFWNYIFNRETMTLI